jgi:hypothetical protein
MEIRSLIDHSSQNTRKFFQEKYNVSTENNCAASGTHFVYDLMKSHGKQFFEVFNNAFLIKSYADKERFQDQRAIFDTGVVLQTDDSFYSLFFGGFEGRLVHKSPDIHTMMEDFRKLKPGPWPDGEIVESLFKQVRLPKVGDHYDLYGKNRDDEDDLIPPTKEILYLSAIVRRDGKTLLKEYNETFSKNQ